MKAEYKEHPINWNAILFPGFSFAASLVFFFTGMQDQNERVSYLQVLFLTNGIISSALIIQTLIFYSWRGPSIPSPRNIYRSKEKLFFIFTAFLYCVALEHVGFLWSSWLFLFCNSFRQIKERRIAAALLIFCLPLFLYFLFSASAGIELPSSMPEELLGNIFYD